MNCPLCPKGPPGSGGLKGEAGEMGPQVSMSKLEADQGGSGVGMGSKGREQPVLL